MKDPAPESSSGSPDAAARELIERAVTTDGCEIALYRRGAAFDVLLDGKLLVASDARRSETSLAELALAPLGQRDDVSVLVAGLGMGHTLRAVLDLPGVQRVDVVEISQAMVDWNRQHLGSLAGQPLADPRVHVHVGDVLGFVKRLRYEPQPGVKDGWFALILDVDCGPGGLSRPENHGIYTDEGLARLEGALRHGGVLGLWSSQRALDLLRLMHARLVNVGEMIVPVDAGLDYVYRGRRPPEPRVNPKAN